MLYIRTDANETIATGHVMRCLTIAEKIREKKGKVCFLVSDETSAALINKNKFEVIVTDVKWDSVNVEKEYQILKQIAKKTDWLLIDSYFIFSEYTAYMKTLLNVAVFDDMFSEKKIADMIINYNVFYRKFDYKSRYEHEKCKLLLGEKYVPLRQQFQQIEPEHGVRTDKYPKVLLMCGGADKPNLIITTIQYLKEHNPDLFLNCEWKIVVGKYYTGIHKLEELIQRDTNVNVLHNVENMAELMKDCDLCVTAASTVLYECCAMLLPTLFFVVADDQKYDAEYFSQDNMLLYCGDYRNSLDESMKNMETKLKDLIEDPEKQYQMKKLMQGFVDSKGAERIATTLMGGNSNE